MHFNDIIALFCIVAILTWASPGVGQGERPPRTRKICKGLGRAPKPQLVMSPDNKKKFEFLLIFI